MSAPAVLAAASVVAERDGAGTAQLYVRRDGAGLVWSSRLRPLLRTTTADGAFDGAGLAFAWGQGGDPTRSVLAGIDRLLPGQQLWSDGQASTTLLDIAPTSLESALTDSLAQILDDRTALWLSGGLDSALLLAMARALGHRPTTYVLRPLLSEYGGRGYDESEAALSVARYFGAEPVVVEASVGDFVAALPATVAAVELPLWNLHPVSKWLLARRTAADGFARALTGDGADEAFAPRPDDYLPLVGDLGRAAGVTIASPFFAPAVRAAACERGADKHALRQLARSYLPSEICARPKRSCLAPELPLPFDTTRLTRLTSRLPVAPRTPVEAVTLALLCDSLGLAF